jgi:ABC-2 type transport system permease protein
MTEPRDEVGEPIRPDRFGGLRTTGLVLAKELRQGWRDRSVLLLVFLVPLLLAGVTTLAFGDLGQGETVTVGVVDHDGGSAAQILVYHVLPGLEVGGTALVDTELLTTDAAARAMTGDGKLAAAIVIPHGFGVSINTGRPLPLTLYTGSDTAVGVPVAQAVLGGYASQVGAIGLALHVTSTGPGGRTITQRVMENVSRLAPPVSLDDTYAASAALRPAGYFAPSMLVLALLFCGQISARGLVGERRRRTLTRIAMAGVPLRRVLAGKYLGALLTGLLAAAVNTPSSTAAGTSFGNPAALFVLVLAAAAAMIGVTSLVALAARTEGEAVALGTTVAFVLAIAGGNFVPLSRTPPVLADLALATPNGWATRAFADLSTAQGSAWSAVGPAVGVLACFALLAAVPALLPPRLLERRIAHV